MTRLRASEMRDGLAQGGRGAAGLVWRRFGANLVVVELATAMVLLVGAGLLGKSFYRLLHVDIGLQPDHIAMLRIEWRSRRNIRRTSSALLWRAKCCGALLGIARRTGRWVNDEAADRGCGLDHGIQHPRSARITENTTKWRSAW